MSDFHEYTADPSQRMPWEYLEPETDIRTEDDRADDRLEVLKVLFEIIFDRTKGGPERIEAGFRRFACLTHILKPELLDGLSQTAMARLFGVSAACASKISNELADLLGVRGTSMKGQHARESMRQGQIKRTRKPKHGTPTKNAHEVHDEAVRRGCESARTKILASRPWTPEQIAKHLEVGRIVTGRDGQLRLTEKGRRAGLQIPKSKNWTRWERISLAEAGYLDDGGEVTATGRLFFEDATDGGQGEHG